jgi:hypothetical protein
MHCVRREQLLTAQVASRLLRNGERATKRWQARALASVLV